MINIVLTSYQPGAYPLGQFAKSVITRTYAIPASILYVRYLPLICAYKNRYHYTFQSWKLLTSYKKPSFNT